MKILVINQPVNNRGDESAHKALIRSLSQSFPLASIEVLIIGEPVDSVRQFAVSAANVRYTPWLCYKLVSSKFYNRFFNGLVLSRFYSGWIRFCLLNDKLSWLKFNPLVGYVIRKICSSDIIVNAPGGICMGGFQNWKHIGYLEIARHHNKDIFYYGRSFGPFSEATPVESLFKKLSIELLNYFTFLSIRDQKTEICAKEHNISYIKTVDTAFLETPLSDVPLNLLDSIGDDFMVFVPNVLKWHYAYKNIPQERIDRLYLSMLCEIHNLYPDFKIVMLPQTFNYRNELMDDINYFKYLKSLTPHSNNIVIIDDIYSSDIQQAIISKSKFLVGARYHSAVFAINNKVPFIALSYEHKISGMLSTLGGLEYLIDIHDLSSDSLVDIYLQKFREKLACVSFDEQLYINAKQISKYSYECFLTKVHAMININQSE